MLIRRFSWCLDCLFACYCYQTLNFYSKAIAHIISQPMQELSQLQIFLWVIPRKWYNFVSWNDEFHDETDRREFGIIQQPSAFCSLSMVNRAEMWKHPWPDTSAELDAWCNAWHLQQWENLNKCVLRFSFQRVGIYCLIRGHWWEKGWGYDVTACNVDELVLSEEK